VSRPATASIAGKTADIPGKTAQSLHSESIGEDDSRANNICDVREFHVEGDDALAVCLYPFVKLLPLPQPQLRAHIRTDKSKRPESHSTKECARACVLCLKTEPKYY
jgi:hypothetical protein